MAAAPVQTVPFSPVIFLTLLLVLGASSVMFWLLSWRATSRRRWVTLSEWGHETGFYFRPLALMGTPPPFNKLPASARGGPGASLGASGELNVRLSMTNGRTTLMQFQTDPVAPPPGSPEELMGGSVIDPEGDASPSRPSPGGASLGEAVAIAASRHDVWHVLIRRVGGDWKPTGLRPAGAGASVLDLFSLSSFPRLGDPERFVVYGTDSEAARAVAESFARALLPRDVGLLLHGKYLVLDFSDRSFDTIEFNRMLALADQVVGYVRNAKC